MLVSLIGFLIQWLPVGVSLVYFFTSPVTQHPVRRVLASAHGVGVTAMFFANGWLLGLHSSSPWIGDVVAVLIVGWGVLVVAAFGFYRGPRLIHLLLPLEAPCFIWAAFVGVVAAHR